MLENGRISPAQLLKQGLGLIRTPLYQSSAALIISTAANGLTGLVFWVAAARLFNAEEVGRGAAAVSALMLVSMLGFTGVQFSVIRFTPIAGRSTLRLALASYAVALAIGLICAGGLLIAAATLVHSLHFLVANPYRPIAFLAAVVPWVIFSLEDPLLIGLRRANWVPVENATFGLLRVVVLAGLSGIVSGTWAVFLAWTLTAALLVVPVNLAIFLKFVPSNAESTRRADAFQAREIVQFSVANHAAGILSALPDSLMPIVVLNIAGGAANAYFYTARTVVFALRLVAINIANVFTAEAAASEHKQPRLFRWAFLLAAALFIPAIVVLLVEAHLILRLFGPDYAANGIALTRIMALGLLPFAAVALYTALARVSRQLKPLLLLAAISTAANLSLGVLLVEEMGIKGAGIAWLVAQSAAAVAALLIWRPGLARGGEKLTREP